MTLRDKLRNAMGRAPTPPPAAAFAAKAAGGKGKLSGGHWVTTSSGHHLYIKGGSIVAGEGKQGGKGPHAAGGGKPAGAYGPGHPEYEKSFREAAARHDAGHGGRSYTEGQYAKEHGIGGANAFAHLDKLHREGKASKDPKTGSFFVPHDAPHPPGSKASAPAAGHARPAGDGTLVTPDQHAAHHGVGRDTAAAHLDKLHRDGVAAKSPHSGAYFVPHGAPAPPGSKASTPGGYKPGDAEYERKFREASARADARPLRDKFRAARTGKPR